MKFSANREAYVTINRKIHTAINGDKIESKRSTAPTVAEVVAAYLGAKPSSIDADHDTRKNNVSALRIVTRGVVSGSEPVIVKNKDGSYELTEPGFWSASANSPKRSAKIFWISASKDTKRGRPMTSAVEEPTMSCAMLAGSSRRPSTRCTLNNSSSPPCRGQGAQGAVLEGQKAEMEIASVNR